MDLQCQNRDCKQSAQLVCMMDQQIFCFDHHDAHQSLPGSHAVTRLRIDAACVERSANPLGLLQQACNSAVSLELHHLKISTQADRDEMARHEQQSNSLVNSILRESQELIAVLKQVASGGRAELPEHMQGLTSFDPSEVEQFLKSPVLKDAFRAVQSSHHSEEAKQDIREEAKLNIREEVNPMASEDQIDLVEDTLPQTAQNLPEFQQVKQARRSENEPLLAQSLFHLGRVYWETSHNKDAIPVLKAALAISRRLGLVLIRGAVTTLIGEIILELDGAAQALTYFEEAIQVLRNQREPSVLGRTLIKTSAALAAVNRTEESLQRMEEAVACFGEAGEAETMLTYNVELARLYANDDEPFKALEILNSTVAMAANYGMEAQQAIAVRMIGCVYNKYGSFEEAAEQFEEARRLFEECGQQAQAVEVLDLAGQALFNGEMFDQAENAFQRSLELATRLNLTGQAAVARQHLQETTEQSGSRQKEFYNNDSCL